MHKCQFEGQCRIVKIESWVDFEFGEDRENERTDSVKMYQDDTIYWSKHNIDQA